MHRIIRDFLRAELRALCLLLLLIAALLGYLICAAELRAEYALFFPLLVVLVLLRARRSTAVFRDRFEALPPAMQERAAREYAAPHPCFPLYQGEAHLLSECLVCRSRRTLLLLPAGSIVVARVQHYSGRNRVIGDLLLTCEDGKAYRLEFLGKQKLGLQSIADALHKWGIPFEGGLAKR